MDENYVWTPPGLDRDDTKEFLSLGEGIPVSANESIYRWITGNKYNSEGISADFLIDFQTALRVDLGLLHANYTGVGTVKDLLRDWDQKLLEYLVDFLLSRKKASLNPEYSPQEVTDLKEILRTAGSGWTVGTRNGRYGLREALPDGVVDTVQNVVSENAQAGSLLRSAWESAFGIHPRPSHAYFDAVRAVEVFSCPLISPRDKQATLGKDINVIRNSPHKWRFVLGDSSELPVEQVLSMMRLLWHSQTDRHGREDYVDVSADEAQAAVLLSSTLVGWFSKGMLYRVDSK